MRSSLNRSLQRRPLEHRLRGGLLAAVLLLAAAAAFAQGTATEARAQAVGEQAQAEQYRHAWQAYEQQAAAYWKAIADKRSIRHAKRRNGERVLPEDYVPQQPPVYAGPPRPPSLAAPPAPRRPEIPVVADFLRHASEQFGFVPRQPPNELAFKRAYAEAAIDAGLAKEQVVGLYVLETGGNGTHDTQAGFPGPGRPAVSPALGYNQLLSTTTIGLIAEHGDRLIEMLAERMHGMHGLPKQEMQQKIVALRRMIAFSRSVPFQWSEHDRLAKTTAGGMGIHAVLLDLDLGPWLQARNLAESVRYARAHGLQATLTPAELQLMNLAGPGNGLDMVMMPPELRRRVPTANFFQQAGYERNPIVQRAGVVSGLIAYIEERIERGAREQGARDLAAVFVDLSPAVGHR